MSLASWRQQGLSVRSMATRLGRSPSTISRQLRRNATPDGYASAPAQAACQHRHALARPPRKLDCQGQARNKHVPRSKGEDRRDQIADMLSIHVRLPEVNDRQFPGHWEGNLIKGAGNASAVGTLVEHTSRLLMLVKLPHPKPASAANALQAFTDKLLSIAEPMRQTLTYDQGREMALDKQLTAATKMAVYFCDPHSPWQRGGNENANGLVRQYLPKGTDLSVYSQAQLDAIADQINNRPRKGLGVRTPLAVYRQLLPSCPPSVHRLFPSPAPRRSPWRWADA